MVDISFMHNDLSDKVNLAIDTLFEARNVHRDYLGLSQVGIVHDCPRMAWYAMKNTTPTSIDGRVLRLFRSGEDIEDNVVLDLKDVGFTVHSSQKEVVATQGDLFFKGHIDGIIEGLDAIGYGKKPCLFECKSCNQKKFNELLKLNDYCLWGGNAYSAQVHIYATLLKLDRIFTMVENKNTSERKFFRFHRDRKFAIETLQFAFLIMEMEEPPTRISNRPNWYKCKFCNYHGTCHG